MRQSLNIVAAAMLLASAGEVFAASSVDLSVKGSITPSACTPLLSNGGVVDHGKISAQDLNPNGNTVLPQASLQLSLTCEAATLVAVRGKDNRAGTSAEPDFGLPNYGLGLAAGDKKIGWYTLKMGDTSADGVPRVVIESMDGQTWLDAYSAIWQPGWLRTVNGADNANPVPLPLTTFKTEVLINTTLTARRELPVNDEILIDGSATFDVVYL